MKAIRSFPSAYLVTLKNTIVVNRRAGFQLSNSSVFSELSYEEANNNIA